jgi:1-acyl-sn-glycerol-3-phosphate acyltransferase
MIRTITWFTYFWTYFLFSFPKLKKARRLKREGKSDALEEYLIQLSNKWSNKLLKLAGIEVIIKGKENLPKNSNVLFVSNHQGNFDIPILINALNQRVAFIAKKEIKKMPFIGEWMTLINCIFIDREDVRQSVRAINKGAKQIKNGQAMVVFPEGTRSKDGKLNEFKAGSLKLAVKADADIIPVTIDGSINALKKGELIIKPAQVTLTIGKAIVLKPDERDTTVIAEKVKAVIEKNLKGD